MPHRVDRSLQNPPTAWWPCATHSGPVTFDVLRVMSPVGYVPRDGISDSAQDGIRTRIRWCEKPVLWRLFDGLSTVQLLTHVLSQAWPQRGWTFESAIDQTIGNAGVEPALERSKRPVRPPTLIPVVGTGYHAEVIPVATYSTGGSTGAGGVTASSSAVVFAST